MLVPGGVIGCAAPFELHAGSLRERLAVYSAGAQGGAAGV